MVEAGASAATDVTGFGLAGHLLEMLGDALDAELDFGAVPVLEEAFDLAREGVLPGGSKRNAEAASPFVDGPGLDEAQRAVLFDAQTSGGLLIAIGEPERLLDELAARGVEGAAVIGRLTDGGGRIRVNA
jgi:selenide,water dikinase